MSWIIRRSGRVPLFLSPEKGKLQCSCAIVIPANARIRTVIPAKAGIQRLLRPLWVVMGGGTQIRSAHAVLVFSAIALFSQTLFSQQQYKLGEDDTWKQLETADPATPEGQLLEARKALAAGQYPRAQQLASQWIERNDRHPLLAQAYLIRGDALLGQEDEYEALFEYEYIARVFPGSEIFITALERELEIARMYAGGRLRKLWGLRIFNAEAEAEELFIRVQERLPGSRLAEEAGMDLADYYFTRQKMTLAVDAYALFIENYPRSEELPKARRRLIFSYLASFKGPQFDAAGLYEARSRLKNLQTYHPLEAEQIGAAGLISRIDESNAQKMLDTARWYVRVNNPIAAELTIRRLVKTYPKSLATADALRLIPDILPKLPGRILNEAPNYDALREATLGAQRSSAAPAPPTADLGDKDGKAP
jgi:outer membrane assembly lipoprotein YfiO